MIIVDFSASSGGEKKMNKDEALRAVDISKARFARGDREGALKFARKSLALCETPEGAAWLRALAEMPRPEASGSASAKKTTLDNDDIKKPVREYTPEQLEGIRRIRRVKADLYAVLDVPRDAADTDIKKAYRKVVFPFPARLVLTNLFSNTRSSLSSSTQTSARPREQTRRLKVRSLIFSLVAHSLHMF